MTREYVGVFGTFVNRNRSPVRKLAGWQVIERLSGRL